MFLLQEILPRAEKIKVRLKEKFQKEYDEFVAEQVRRKLKITFFFPFFFICRSGFRKMASYFCRNQWKRS